MSLAFWKRARVLGHAVGKQLIILHLSQELAGYALVSYTLVASDS